MLTDWKQLLLIVGDATEALLFLLDLALFSLI